MGLLFDNKEHALDFAGDIADDLDPLTGSSGAMTDGLPGRYNLHSTAHRKGVAII